MEIISIIIFFAISYGLGFMITSFMKNSENNLEKNLMRISLRFFSILAVLLRMIKVPVQWLIYLIISLAYPVYSLVRNLFSGSRSPKLNLAYKTDTVFIFGV